MPPNSVTTIGNQPEVVSGPADAGGRFPTAAGVIDCMPGGGDVVRRVALVLINQPVRTAR